MWECCHADPAAYASSPPPCVGEIWPKGTATGTGRWWSNPERTTLDSTPRPWDREHTAAGRSQSRPAQNPHRFASLAFHWRRPKWSVPRYSGSPYGRACCRWHRGRPQYHGGSRDRSVARRPWPETGRGTKSSEVCSPRGSGSHISGTRRPAENPSAAKRRFVRYSHLIVAHRRPDGPIENV